MIHVKEVGEVFDDWRANLTPKEKAWCERAVKNATSRIGNVGEVSAKELVVAVLLFYQARQANNKRPGLRPDLSAEVGENSGGVILPQI